MCIAVCRRRCSDVAASAVDFVFVLLLFLFLLLHANGVVVSYLFPAMDIGVTASYVAVAVVLGAILPQVENKMAPITMTVTTTNEMHHGAPSTLPSDPHPREGEGEGEGNKGKGGGYCRGRQW